ncbi:hypothetical protein GQ457_10G014390 [Hibiscus cannabinus]
MVNPKLVRVDIPSTWGSDNRQNNGAPKPGLKCFLCQGHHRVAECPQRSGLTALRTTAQDSNQNIHSEDNTEKGSARVGSIRFLYAFRSEQDKAKTEKERGLMYVEIELNGIASKVLVDTGATNTFICPEKAERCNLKLTRGVGRVKAVNLGHTIKVAPTARVDGEEGVDHGYPLCPTIFTCGSKDLIENKDDLVGT